MKMYVVAAKLFHADGQTDRQTDRQDEPSSRFSQFRKSTYRLLLRAVMELEIISCTVKS